MIAVRREEEEDPHQAATSFLGQVVLNNAIAYPQDRASRDWIFGYYVNSAGYWVVLADKDKVRRRVAATLPHPCTIGGLLPH